MRKFIAIALFMLSMAACSTTKVPLKYYNTQGATRTAVPPSGKTVNAVSVVVSYPSRFSFIGPIAAMVGGSGWGTITLTAASVMRVEGGS